VVLGTEDTDLELANGNKTVVIPMLKIYKTNCWAFLTSLAVLTDTGVFQQQGKDVAVVFDQVGSRKAGG